MFRSKLGLLGLCAMVLGVMAISASGAQAAGSWLVGATEITNTSSLPAELTGEIDTAEPKLLTHLIGLTVTVTCKNFTTSGISLKGEGKLSTGGKAVFTGCTVVAKDSEGNPSGNCTVKSSGAAEKTIASNKGKGELVLHEGGVVLTKIEPEVAEEGFATIRFEGEECLLPLSDKVTGTLFVKDCLGQAETFAVKHLVEQGPLTLLSVGAETAEHLLTSIDGSAWVKMTGTDARQEWRAMGV
jgi:hypothetical protein